MSYNKTIASVNVTVLRLTNPDVNLKRMHQLYEKRINILFRILTFAKPECDNVLQPEPRSGEGCNTFSHEGLVNVDIRKRMLYRHCYIPSFQAQAVPNNFNKL